MPSFTELQSKNIYTKEELYKVLSENFHVVQLTKYQWRVNGLIDIYPKNRKYHILKICKRGTFSDENILELVSNVVKKNIRIPCNQRKYYQEKVLPLLEEVLCKTKTEVHKELLPLSPKQGITSLEELSKTEMAKFLERVYTYSVLNFHIELPNPQ